MIPVHVRSFRIRAFISGSGNIEEFDKGSFNNQPFL